MRQWIMTLIIAFNMNALAHADDSQTAESAAMSVFGVPAAGQELVPNHVTGFHQDPVMVRIGNQYSSLPVAELQPADSPLEILETGDDGSYLVNDISGRSVWVSSADVTTDLSAPRKMRCKKNRLANEKVVKLNGLRGVGEDCVSDGAE